MDRVQSEAPAGVAAGADAGLTVGYDLGGFFDEMFEAPGAPRPHYRELVREPRRPHAREPRGAQPRRVVVLPHAGDRLHGLRRRGGHRPHLPLRPRAADRAGRRVGADRARARAADARAQPLPRDVYHDQKILAAGVVPPELVFGSRHFRREMIGVRVPRRDLRARRRHRPRPRPRRPLPRARGQPAHAFGRQLHAREPDGAEADLRAALLALRRAARRGVPAARSPTRCARSRRAAGGGDPAVVLLTPGLVQLGLLRALVPRAADGDRDRRGAGPRRAPQPRLHAHDERPGARRRHLPPHRRRLPRPARVQRRLAARRRRAS